MAIVRPYRSRYFSSISTISNAAMSLTYLVAFEPKGCLDSGVSMPYSLILTCSLSSVSTTMVSPSVTWITLPCQAQVRTGRRRRTRRVVRKVLGILKSSVENYHVEQKTFSASINLIKRQEAITEMFCYNNISI